MNHYQFLEVTQAGAKAAAKWVGKGDKKAADAAATNAMRDALENLPLFMKVAIGEGIKDQSEGLYQGEALGSEKNAIFGVDYLLAVDPIEGTTPTANFGNEALSVLAVSDRYFFQTDRFYMYKLAVGPQIYKALGEISLNDSIYDIVSEACRVSYKHISEFTICILDRPRHQDIIKKLRSLNCRVKLIQDCDVTACIQTCLPEHGIDMYLGVGGATEGILSAVALNHLGGYFVGALTDNQGINRDFEELQIPDLISGDSALIATGITDGSLLNGVKAGTCESFIINQHGFHRVKTRFQHG